MVFDVLDVRRRRVGLFAYQIDISHLLYCNLHDALVDVREIHWKEKSTGGQQPVWSNAVGSSGSKVTTKPPLPRVARHGRSKRLKNKVKHRHRDEFLFSDNDDCGLKVVGISERSLKSDADGVVNQYKVLGRHSHSTPDLKSAFLLEAHLDECSRTRSRTRSASLTPSKIGKDINPLSAMNSKTDGSLDSQNRYNIFSRNSFSASDLGSAVRLEMQDNNRLRQRSASLTPNTSSGYGLGEHQRPKNVHRKVKKHKKISSTNMYGCLDDSVVSSNTRKHHNRSKIPRRHSYSVLQLGGDILLNMPTDESLNGSVFYGLEDDKKAKVHSPEPERINVTQFPQRTDEDSSEYDLPIAFIDASKWYGSVDDSAVMRNTSIKYQNSNPRRHSHSIFDLGCEILLNMPVNEQPNNLKFQTRPNRSANSAKFCRRKTKRGKKSFSCSKKKSGYESLDDLVVTFNSDINDRNKDPRRYSYSAFELGDALLSRAQPIDRSSTNHVASATQNGAYNHGFGEPKPSGFQTVHNKNKGYESMDDLVVHEKYNDHRRHSYSAFEFGDVPMLNAQPIDKSSAYQSATMTQNGAYNHGFGEPKQSGFEMMNSYSHPIVFLNKNHGYGFMDDSVVTRNTGIDNHDHYHNQNRIPRRHSYSILQLGGDIILNMPNESISRSFGDSQKSTLQKVEKDKNSLPPKGSVKRFSPSYDDGSDLSIDKRNWHGSFDDSLIYRSVGSESQSNNPRRHSHSAFDLGRALLLEINESTGHGSTGHGSAGHRSTTHGSTGHGSGEHNRHHYPHHRKAKKNNSHLPPPCPMNALGNHNQYHNSNPRRHSYSAFELGSALLQNMQQSDTSSTRRSASVTPKIQIVNESKRPKLKKDEPHGYQSCDESGVSNSRDGRKRSTNLTRSYFSVSDLTSPLLLQMNLDKGLTRRSASLTPDCSLGQGFGDLNSLKFEAGSSSSHRKQKKNDRSKARRSKRSKAKKSKKHLRKVNNVKNTSASANAASDESYESFDDSDAYESLDDSDSQKRFKIFSRNSQMLSMIKKVQEKDPADSSSTNRPDLYPSGLEKIDLRSLDGSIASEIDYNGVEKVKQQAEDDVRSMTLLQSELEAERNAATVAANHAMNMITRLQQEKASLQMEALQYLRMMEEQAEYDMDALQKANELVEEKEIEIQDLLDELEQYRSKYGYDLMNTNMNTIKSFDDEKSYILESLSTLEEKIHQLSNGVYDKSTESENHVEFSKLEHQVLDLKEKMEALQADLDLIRHICNTLHANEGIEFIQEIANQLQDLRSVIFQQLRIHPSTKPSLDGIKSSDLHCEH
ncbi:hypothetical protein M8C21_022085 [Ambrosia artemisiifolia]|uniref:GTD-binding domain-containing protein n=1 Tax=Ambrosia artemisiifolia TaxID=4212 RepID=A0AAD5BXN3_AMBAR|nr:hypothetical protein M8C21_022085 [Ambrosia artemisiifolia]